MLPALGVKNHKVGRESYVNAQGVQQLGSALFGLTCCGPACLRDYHGAVSKCEFRVLGSEERSVEEINNSRRIKVIRAIC